MVEEPITPVISKQVSVRVLQPGVFGFSKIVFTENDRKVLWFLALDMVGYCTSKRIKDSKPYLMVDPYDTEGMKKLRRRLERLHILGLVDKVWYAEEANWKPEWSYITYVLNDQGRLSL